MRTTTAENPGMFFKPEVAIAKAALLQSNDDDWKYEVVHCPKGIGFSFIQIRDEDGEIIGKI